MSRAIAWASFSLMSFFRLIHISVSKMILEQLILNFGRYSTVRYVQRLDEFRGSFLFSIFSELSIKHYCRTESETKAFKLDVESFHLAWFWHYRCIGGTNSRNNVWCRLTGHLLLIQSFRKPCSKFSSNGAP